jgi:hypothetical protein
MTFIQAVTFTFAAIGVASVAFVMFRWLFGKGLREDGPIRVKRGSIKIENDDADWEKDDSEGPNEYHLKGKPNRWNVKVDKNGQVCIPWVQSRIVKLRIERDDGSNGTVTFRANGAVRVKDDDNRFVATGRTLEDRSARVKKVVIKPATGQPLECDFGANDVWYVELKPLS